MQLIYSDIAWDLLHEDYQNGHLAVSRLDRFSDHFKLVDVKSRGLTPQWQSLQVAHQLLEAGWGLYLGEVEDQQREREGQLSFINVTVRFFPEVMAFIQEAEKRHPSQKISHGPKLRTANRPTWTIILNSRYAHSMNSAVGYIAFWAALNSLHL